MRKRLIVLIMTGVMAVSLASCGESSDSVEISGLGGQEQHAAGNEDTDAGSGAGGQHTDGSESQRTGETDREVSAAEDGDTESTNSSRAEEISDNNGVTEQVFWFNQAVWGEKKENFEGNLFDTISLPINLTDFDEVGAPYLMFYEYDSASYYSLDAMEKLLNQDFPVKLREQDVDLTTSDAVSLTSKDPNDRYGLWSIRFYNLSSDGTDLPIKTCYENGWWIVVCGRKALGLELNGSENKRQLLDDMLEKYGRPDYITSEYDIETIMPKNDGHCYYSLIYEYPEFTIAIIIFEGILQDDPENQFSGMAEITNVVYYTAECWEIAKERSEEQIFEVPQ